MEKEDFILKKIRHFQGSVADYASYWEKKIADGKAQESKDTKALKSKNDDLNKDYEIIPVERD
jgi:hypothetical protein